MSTKPASSALCYALVNPGLHTPYKNGSSRCSTWGAFVGFLNYMMAGQGAKQWCSLNLVFHPSSHSYINVAYAGWATFNGWKMGASLRICSMVNLPLGLGVEAAPNYTSRMYASMTWKHATLNLSHGKPLQTTEPCGSSNVTRTEKRGGCNPRKKNDERQARRKVNQQQDHTAAHQASVFTCQGSSRDCKSRIGLYSHTRWCSSMTYHGTTP